MITFLPYADYDRSAAVLDRQRLGKQRIEVLALLSAGSRLRRHPACRMWRGHRVALATYGASICREWVARGYADTTLARIEALASPLTYGQLLERGMLPKWSGLARLHESHQSRLLSKDPAWYGRFSWSVEPGRPYHWPLTLSDVLETL